MTTEIKRKDRPDGLAGDKYFNLIEHAADGIAIIQDGVFKLVNTALTHISGYDKEELLGMPFTELLTPASQKLTMKRYQARMAGKQVPQIYEVQAITKDGQIRDIELNATLTEYDGRVADEAIVRDITERKQAEQALADEATRRHILVDQSRDGIVVLDEKGNVYEANKSFADMLGYTPEETAELHVWDWEYLYPRKRVLEMIRTVDEAGDHFETQHRRKDGSVYDVEISTNGAVIAGQKLIFCVCRDITERKKMEQLQKGENYVLTLLGQGAELGELLDAIVHLGEQNDPSIKGSVLLFDPSKSKELLFQASAPSLPDDYKELFANGIPIGPKSGSCGTAAYLKERVVVPDIASSPLFKPLEEIVKQAVNNNLLAVWSQPIIASNGDLLGTIANYSNKLGEPSAENLKVLEWSARIAAIAIEHKRAEEALRESEERYRTVIEGAHDMIQSVALDGSINFVNQAWLDALGYTKADLPRLNLVKVIHPDSLPHCRELFAKVVKGEPANNLQATFLTKDGREILVEGNAAPRYIGDKVVATQGILRDITERKNMEKQLQEKNEELDAQNEELKAINEELQATEEELQHSQERLERMFESATDGIVVTTLDGTVLKVNERAAQMIGYAFASELLGKNCLDCVAPGDREKMANNMQKVVKEGLIKRQEYTLCKEDGTEFPGELSTNIIKDASGNAIGLITIARDITERRQAEEREDQLQQELNLASRLASIGQLAAGVAHEINNPLTGVIGFSHLMLSRDIPDDMKQDLQVIHSEAKRVAKIVENLLVFAHQRKTGREYVAINDIITRVLELRAYEMKVNNIELENQLDPDLPLTMADAGQLQQVFLNIILNAEHFMTKAHNKGKLLVKTEKIDGNIRAYFTDDGTGISKENLDNIFNPFFTTKEVGKGTGLGLSICHGIITQHKGRIYAQSQLGKGATFVIELPIVAEPVQAGKAKVTQKEPQKPRGAKILVVDDEEAILTFLSRLLSEWGHSVETINNADTALEKLNAERYSLVLLDIKLPGMSGIELYQRIEDIAPALARRVMFITGDIMEGTTRAFLDKTGAPYITKPLDIEVLKKTINSILTGGAQRLTA